MRKVTLLYLLLLIAAAGNTQTVIHEFSKSYFRSDPFAGSAREFLLHLTNDPDITDKVLNRRTDTSFFNFQGNYKKFNPFFFKPQKLEITLMELAIPSANSKEIQDTIMIYQLAAYAPLTEAGKKDVVREIEKLNRRYRKQFFKALHEDLNSPVTNEVTGVAHHYFMPFHRMPPVTASWITDEEEKMYVVLLTMRLVIKGNSVELPTPFYSTE